jgi:hypothetical protein
MLINGASGYSAPPIAALREDTPDVNHFPPEKECPAMDSPSDAAGPQSGFPTIRLQSPCCQSGVLR